ncbi:MAG: MoaD/ThiS family protein [Leptolinea sp.]|jgi:molybdopterin converting factor small subunit|nr:MoaD/ThiS family protein [Leptolinea sp.]
MQVTVKLFATLTHYGPGVRAGEPFKVDLPENARVIDLINTLHIPSEEAHVVFINNMIVRHETPLKVGSDIGIFPQVAGG